MTIELISQLKDFEIFVERLEKFIEEIKANKTLQEAGFKLEDMDFRTKDDAIFSIPTKLEDYFEIWKDVKECANSYYSEKDFEMMEIWGANEYFLDLYWNDVAGHTAYYQDMVFWVYFSNEKGICYDVDETDTPY